MDNQQRTQTQDPGERGTSKSAKLSLWGYATTYHGTDDGDSICEHMLKKEQRQSMVGTEVNEI